MLSGTQQLAQGARGTVDAVRHGCVMLSGAQQLAQGVSMLSGAKQLPFSWDTILRFAQDALRSGYASAQDDRQRGRKGGPAWTSRWCHPGGSYVPWVTRWYGRIVFSPEFTPSTTLRACPERSRTGQALSEAEGGRAVFLLFSTPHFRRRRKCGVKESVSSTLPQAKRRMDKGIRAGGFTRCKSLSLLAL